MFDMGFEPQVHTAATASAAVLITITFVVVKVPCHQ